MNQQEYEFRELGPVWHLCTPGEHQCAIFRTREDFVFGMNLMALAAYSYREEVKILTFELMSNHFHFVLACEEVALNGFFDFIYKRLKRYLANGQRGSDLNKLTFKYFNIDNLNYLQTVIAYVNRNGYLVDNSTTPFSYPWGANSFFFNRFKENINSIKLSGMSIEKQRQLFKSRNFEIDDNYEFLTEFGYISPASYCHIPLAENCYTNAHHYFNLLSRRVESFSQIARELSDSIIYTDEEIYTAVLAICNKRFDVKNPTLLGKQDKISLAKQLKYDYNASNKQIGRIIKLDEGLLSSLFPGD